MEENDPIRPIRPKVIVNSYRHNMSGIDSVVGNG